MYKCILILLLVFCFFSASTVHIATINGADCSQGDIQEAINAASEGDTVIVPDGSFGWNQAVIIKKYEPYTYPNPLRASSAPASGTYWVSPLGHASWVDSRSDTPLSGAAAASLVTANANAKAGDTVYLRGGTYDVKISPVNSGTSDERISFRAYEGEEVICKAFASISLTNKQYITIDGIKIKLDSCSSSGCYVLLDNSNNIIVEKGVFDEIRSQSGWPTGIYLRNNAHHNTFRNNVIGNAGYESSGPEDAGGVIRFGWDSGDDDSGYNLFENNTLFHGGHHVAEVYTSYNIFRNNILHNDNWYSCSQPGGLCGNRNFIIDGGGSDANWNVIENNRIAFAGIPADAESGSGISLRSGNNIIRNNLMYHNSGPAMSIEEYSYWPHDVSNNHIYNNTFFHNGYSPISTWWAAKYGMLIADQASTFISDLKIKNNIFHGNLNGAIAFSNGVLRENQEISNNMEESADPLFVDENTGLPSSSVLPDLSLQEGSSAIDAGTFLTHIVTASGSGKVFQVQDSGYFTDGFGIVQGDSIQLEGTTQRARIVTIDYATDTITVDNSVTWTQNQGIALPYDGSGPDIGAVEYSSDTSLRGDLYIDGIINVQDIQLCVNVILGIETDSDIIQRAGVVSEPLDVPDVLDLQTIINIATEE